MRFVPRLTYSNVMATVAVFIALGGISWAATQLPKNSVGSKQIKKNSVTARKIKKNAVTTAKIKKNAVNTSRIKGKAVTRGKVDPNLLTSIDEDARPKVLNADGSVLGTLAGTFAEGGGIAIFQVLVDGGLYTYYGSGQLVPLGSSSPSFKNDSCTGTAFFSIEQVTFDQLISKLAGGPSRIVFRAFNGGTFGPISAWQFTKASQNVSGQNLWEFDSNGSCVPDSESPFTGLLAELDAVPAPPDGIGPLTLG